MELALTISGCARAVAIFKMEQKPKLELRVTDRQVMAIVLLAPGYQRIKLGTSPLVFVYDNPRLVSWLEFLAGDERRNGMQQMLWSGGPIVVHDFDSWEYTSDEAFEILRFCLTAFGDNKK